MRKTTEDIFFPSFLEHRDLPDVPLVGDGHQQYKTHQVVMAASRPEHIFSQKYTPHTHPLTYLQGLDPVSIITIQLWTTAAKSQ